jgi:Flp pilus assembly pilin Flp
MDAIRRFAQRFRFELGQTTAEYALVMLAAAAVVAVLIAWAQGEDNGLKDFFSSIIEKISSSVSGGGGGSA